MIVAKLLARDFNNEYMHLLHTNEVKITCPQPTAWTLDGEFGGELNDVIVRVRHDELKLVY
ncbi:hypothetical protein EVA_14848 [gut metagenome]|uniref:Uncharacterized protein n=1 Tax=gut metagenome TaxID=749906 RepID=J9GCE5_9ZZZZ